MRMPIEQLPLHSILQSSPLNRIENVPPNGRLRRRQKPERPLKALSAR